MHTRLVGTNPNGRSNRATLFTCQMPHETGRDERRQPQSHQSRAAGRLASVGGDDVGKNVARATVIGVAAMYGTNFASVKILEEAMPPSVAAALRFAIASIVLLPLFGGANRKVVLPSIEIGLLTAGGYYAQGMSLAGGGADASTSAFLCSLAVIVCPLLDFVQGTRKLGRSEAVAIALAVAGTGVLELTGSVPGARDVWAMVQPLAFGTAFWKVEQLMRKFPTQANAITALQVATVGLFSLAWALLDVSSGGAGLEGLTAAASSVADVLQTDGRLVPALIWTSVFTTALTVWLETKALGKLSSSETTLLFSTEPLWGAAFAHAALGEHLDPNIFVGGALILAACLSRSITPLNDALPPTASPATTNSVLSVRSGLVEAPLDTIINTSSLDTKSAVTWSSVTALPSSVWLGADVRRWQKVAAFPVCIYVYICIWGGKCVCVCVYMYVWVCVCQAERERVCVCFGESRCMYKSYY